MLITTPCVVSLTWKLQDTQGTLIDELQDPVEFFFGGDDLLAKVEEALTDQEAGFTTALHLEPEHAFGDYKPELVFSQAITLYITPVIYLVLDRFSGKGPVTTPEGQPAIEKTH